MPLPLTLTGPNQEALSKGFANLEQHIANAKAHGVPVVVARGYDIELKEEASVRELLRPEAEDLFR